MKNDLTQFVGSSKSSKKFYEETLKLVNQNPQDYSKATKERLSAYAREGGRFDSDLKLDPSFDPNESFKSMASEVKNLGMKYSDWEINAAGDMYTSTGEQSVDMVKSILDSQIDSDIQQRGEEASDYWNQPGVYEKKLEELENTVSRDVKSKMKTDRNYWNSGAGKVKKDAASLMKNYIKHLQVYVPGESDRVFDLLKGVRTPSGEIRNVTHSDTMKDEDPDKPKEGSVIIEFIKNKGTAEEAIVKEVVSSDKYNVFYNLLTKTKGLTDVNQEALDKVPDYVLPDSDKKYDKPEISGSDSYNDSFISFLKNPQTMAGQLASEPYDGAFRSDLLKAVKDQKAGLTPAQIKKQANNPDLETMMSVINKRLKGKNIITKNGESRIVEGLSFDDKTLEIEFKSGGDMELDTNNPDDQKIIEGVISEMLGYKPKKVKGTEVVIEEDSVTSDDETTEKKSAVQIALELKNKTKK